MWRHLTGRLVLLAIFAGISEQPDTRMFGFDSGGAFHPEGFGAWRFKVDGDVATIEHRVGERTIRDTKMTLTQDEVTELWALVDRAQLDRQPFVNEAGPPDTIAATFVVSRGTDTLRVTVRLDSQRESSPLMALVRGIARLIEKHTGEHPVLL